MAGVALAGLVTPASPVSAWPSMAVQPRPVGRVVGVVYDSISRATLSGALVQLVALNGTLRLAVTSDSTGRFAFPPVERGRFLLGFFHPKLDSLGVESPLSRVEVQDESVHAIDLAVPSVTTVLRQACGSGATRDSSGAVVGFVRSASTTGAEPEATVRARWSEIMIGKRGAEVRVREVTAHAGEDGWFSLCQVPAGGLVLVNAAAGRDSGATLEVSVPNDGLLVRDLFVATREGHRTVRGTVRTPYGAALAGARVRLYGETREVRSNDRGEFTLAGVPATDAGVARAWLRPAPRTHRPGGAPGAGGRPPAGGVPDHDRHGAGLRGASGAGRQPGRLHATQGAVAGGLPGPGRRGTPATVELHRPDARHCRCGGGHGGRGASGGDAQPRG